MEIIREILSEIQTCLELEDFDSNAGIQEENHGKLRISELFEIIFENLLADFIKDSVERVFSDFRDTISKSVETKPFEKNAMNKKRKVYNEVPYYESEKEELSEDEPESKELFPKGSEEIYSAAYHQLWLERKVILEKEAERRARVTARQWQKERVSLKKLIDDSLKEYIDLYEKAHALYLQFEHEKTEFISRFQSKEFNNSLDYFQYEIPDDFDAKHSASEPPDEKEINSHNNPIFTITPNIRKRKFTVPRKET